MNIHKHSNEGQKTNIAVNVPKIHRLGTIDRDIVESNVVVFKGELYRFEGIRWAGFSHPYYANIEKNSYCRLVRMRDNAILPPFGFGLHMGNAFVYNDKIYVTAVDDHKTIRPYLYLIVSDDLEHWSEPRKIFGGPGWRIHNSTLCPQSNGRFILGMECDHQAGLFAMFFAESDNLMEFRYLPGALHGPGYTGGPILRSFGEYFYLFFITGGYESEFVLNITRSKDLCNWEMSELNPIMKPDDAEDKKLYPGVEFSKEELARMQQTRNINVSDMDFCEWNGKLVFNYSWGDQKGVEFLALAEVEATERNFCENYFIQA